MLILFMTRSLCHLVDLEITSVLLILSRGDLRLGKHIIYPNCFEKDVLYNKLQALKVTAPGNDAEKPP